jgi:hypothetical protein
MYGRKNSDHPARLHIDLHINVRVNKVDLIRKITVYSTTPRRRNTMLIV